MFLETPRAKGTRRLTRRNEYVFPCEDSIALNFAKILQPQILITISAESSSYDTFMGLRPTEADPSTASLERELMRLLEQEK
jgi:hypothetical protein